MVLIHQFQEQRINPSSMDNSLHKCYLRKSSLFRDSSSSANTYSNYSRSRYFLNWTLSAPKKSILVQQQKEEKN